MAGGRARQALAIAHAVAGCTLIGVLLSLSPCLFHVAVLGILHIAASYGLLRGQSWTPWLLGILAAMGGAFAGFSIYAPIGLFGLTTETYLLITGFTAYVILLLISLLYAIYRRKEFST